MPRMRSGPAAKTRPGSLSLCSAISITGPRRQSEGKEDSALGAINLGNSAYKLVRSRPKVNRYCGSVMRVQARTESPAVDLCLFQKNLSPILEVRSIILTQRRVT
jgi:hypothetical protein